MRKRLKTVEEKCDDILIKEKALLRQE